MLVPFVRFLEQAALYIFIRAGEREKEFCCQNKKFMSMHFVLTHTYGDEITSFGCAH